MLHTRTIVIRLLRMKTKIDRHALLYIPITLVLSTAYAIVALQLDIDLMILAVGFMCIPALVGVVFIKLVHKETLTDYGLGRRAGLGGLKLWLITFWGPLLVYTIPLALLSLLVFKNPVHPKFTWSKFALIVGAIIPLLTIFGTFTTCLGEEFGWRGYLLRRLHKSLSLRATTLIVGVVWAIYHLPIVLLSDTGVWPTMTAVTYSVTVIAQSVIFTYFAVRARHGSVFIAALLHSSLNTWNQCLISEPAFGGIGLLLGDKNDSWILSVEGLAGMLLTLILAAAFWPSLTRMDKEGETFKPPKPAKQPPTKSD